jgi:molybdenum cofactor biosynthesis enzyme MoaA
MVDIYSMDGHKLYWHIERVNDWLQGKKIVPLSIDMGITQACNLDCMFCYYGSSQSKTNMMIPTNALISFVNDCSEIGVKGISFAGDGEPMIHPGVYSIVSDGYKAGLDMAISTNGVYMKHGKLKNLLESLTLIRFTVGAAEKNAYAKVMGGANEKAYDKVLCNIKKCVELKYRSKLDITIGMQMICTLGEGTGS